MGHGIAQQQVILLFDRYDSGSKDLHHSFRAIHCHFPALVIEDNGFLPDGVQSIYGSYLGDYRNSCAGLGRPRYFNEVEIPDYWEISATNLMGQVCDLNHERARIFFSSPTHNRHVQTVEWLDEAGTVRYADHYNKYGAIFARTTMQSNGQRMMKSYFSADGREMIVENYLTGDVILNDGDEVRIFPNKTQFVCHFLSSYGYDRARLFFNSLSTPFFVSCQLPAAERKDVLFWQENIQDAIPGNMKMILDGSAQRVEKIYVQKQRAYDKLMALGADPNLVQRKGFLYSFRRENLCRPSALICTNSDQIEQCEALVSTLPQVEFHIAALTEMSSKLMNMGRYANVHLYPAIKKSRVGELFAASDIYLDINHGGEILNGVRRAFINNLVIYSFANTLHNPDFVAPEQVYQPEHADQMIAAIQALAGDPKQTQRVIALQHQAALEETPQSFSQI